MGSARLALATLARHRRRAAAVLAWTAIRVLTPVPALRARASRARLRASARLGREAAADLRDAALAELMRRSLRRRPDHRIRLMLLRVHADAAVVRRWAVRGLVPGRAAAARRQGTAALARLARLLESHARSDGRGSEALLVGRGAVHAREISIDGGDEHEALRKADLHISARRLTVLTGPPGCGKTTLLRILAGLAEPDSGRVWIDSQPLARATTASIRSAVAFVPQRPVLFDGTVLDNVRIGRPAARRDEVARALATACPQLLCDLPHGLDTRVGRGGVPLEVREVHRLALARALLARPKILLVDASPDVPTETELIEILRRVRRWMTVAVIATSPDALKRSDQVLAVEHGEVVAVDPLEYVARGPETRTPYRFAHAGGCASRRGRGER